MSADQSFAVATHAMCVMAFNGQTPSTSAFIGSSINVNPTVVKRVVKLLVNAGFVESLSGATGGYRLCRPASEISLWDIFFAIKKSGPFDLRYGMPHSSCEEGRRIDAVVLKYLQDGR
jgi:Rrf2 family protein